MFIREQFNRRNNLNESIDYYNYMEDICMSMDVQERIDYLTNTIEIQKQVENIILFPKNTDEYLQQIIINDISELDIDLDSITEDDLEDRIQDLNQLLLEAEHVESYNESVQNIFNRVDTLNQFSIFADTNSYTYKETQKSADDFQLLDDISISFCRVRTFTAFMNYNDTAYFLLIFLIFIIIAFFDERKRGLWATIHACCGITNL